MQNEQVSTNNQQLSHLISCPICLTTNTIPFIELSQVPVHCNLLWPTRVGALSAPRGDIELGFCPDCGHVFNLTYDPSLMEYTQDYENSLHFSPRFQRYAASLARRLVDRYDVRNKDIIELGAGKGDFLTMLSELGGNRGVGFDPSYVPDPEETENKQLTFIQDFYSDKYSDYEADLICCRHVLEHVEDPNDLVATVRLAAGHRHETVVFFEVPNVLFTLNERGVWDIIYEHCSYFSPYSLARLFWQNDFKVLDISTTFEGQFLTIETLPSHESLQPIPSQANELAEMAVSITAFARSYRQIANAWQQHLQQIKDMGQRAVVWGAGSKGVTFLNTFKEQDVVEFVVDINLRKWGMHVAGTGQEIVPPDFLRTYHPEVVIVMNSNYKDEIRQQLIDLGITARIMTA
jgi:SAM-dependent methyltransferase